MKSKLIILAMAVAALALDFFFPLEGGELWHMATLIGVLTTGAGVITTFAARDHCDMYIMIGDVDTAMPLSGLVVEVGGEAYINLIGSQPLVSAFSKYMMNIAGGGVVGLMFKIASGRINRTTTYKLTNNGATTPNIFAFSDAKSNGGLEPAVLSLATVGVQAGSSEDFKDFTALFITSSANITSLDIDYLDGHRESGLTAAEVDAMFALNNPSEANGRLDAVVTTIDNRKILGIGIANVRVTVATGGTAVTVAVLKLDEKDWMRLKPAA